MYMNEAIERINNIRWDLVGKNISKSDAYYGCEFLRRLAKFFKDESIKPIKPLMTNIAKLLGDDGERINLSQYLNKDAMEFIGDRMFKFIFEHYLQLARYSDENPYAAKYLSVYDPLLKLLEKGGEYTISMYELEVPNVSRFILRGWYEDFKDKKSIDIDKLS